MENRICHSNQSSNSVGIKNTIYVEANVLSMYAELQLHPPYGSEEKVFSYYFRKFTLHVVPATNQIKQIWTKVI